MGIESFNGMCERYLHGINLLINKAKENILLCLGLGSNNPQNIGNNFRVVVDGDCCKIVYDNGNVLRVMTFSKEWIEHIYNLQIKFLENKERKKGKTRKKKLYYKRRMRNKG